jgi:hypothetical protein
MSSPLDDWPAYPIGPKDSIFALGVASCKFAELESIVHFMFATVFDFGLDTAIMIASKIGLEATIELTERQLPKTGWVESINDLVSYFFEGFGICFENRNHLMHSNFTWAPVPILYKTTKKGTVQIAAPSFSELRQIADDMNAFTRYGRQLANAINNQKIDADIPKFPASAFPLPDKPPLPRRLDYSPDPRAL